MKCSMKNIIKELVENNNITIISDKETIVNILFEYCGNATEFCTGRYNKDELFLMLSKVNDIIIVESLESYNGNIYECFASNIIITKDVLEYAIARKQLDNIVDYCEEFKVVGEIS